MPCCDQTVAKSIQRADQLKMTLIAVISPDSTPFPAAALEQPPRGGYPAL
jgi:hypothetical protein